MDSVDQLVATAGDGESKAPRGLLDLSHAGVPAVLGAGDALNAGSHLLDGKLSPSASDFIEEFVAGDRSAIQGMGHDCEQYAPVV
jgi:hypothetical protein